MQCLQGAETIVCI